MKYMLFSMFIFSAISSFAQVAPNAVAPTTDAPAADQKVFWVVEQMPMFPQGQDSLRRFIETHIQYPDMERKADIQGRVIVRMVVQADGSLTNAEVIRTVSPGLDKEALRVVSILPKFNPGKQQNHTVNVYYTVPVIFRLPGGDDIKEPPVYHKEEIVKRTDKTSDDPVVTVAAVREDDIYTFVEQMPMYPGGEMALMDFIKSHIVHPAMESNIQGRVVVGFVVEKDGSLSDISVKRGVSPALDKEAIRVVKLLGKFNPGRQQGKAVRVRFLLPIQFKITASSLPDK